MLRRAFVTGLFLVFALSSTLFAIFDRDAEGGGRTRVVSVSNTPGTQSAHSELAADGKSVYLVWSEGERQIRFRGSSDRGSSFGDGPSGRVLATVPRGESILTLRAAASGERLAILYSSATTPDLGRVSLIMSGDRGATFSAPMQFDRSGGSPNADLAIDAEGRLHLVLEDRGATNRIVYLWSEDGQTFSERVLSEDAAFEPRVAAWKRRLGVVWADASGRIRFTTSSDSGATFSAPLTISRSEEPAATPSIAAGDSIHVVWTEARSLLHARSLDLGLTFSEPATLADGADAPRVAIAGASVRVTWTSGGRSFLRRSSMDGASFGDAIELSAGVEGEVFGGVAIIPSSFDRIAWPHTTTRAPRDAEILFVEAANALPCGTSWKDPVSGNWNDATKWSNGIPFAGANACITVDGNYTVTVPVNSAAATLQVGNPANVSGQPTLVVQVTLNISSEVVNDGFIRLDHPTTGTAYLLASPLTNNGHFETAPGNALMDGTAVVNNGTFEIKGILTNNTTLATFTNRGTMTIHPGCEFRPRHNFRFYQNDGLFQCLGLLNISSSTVDADYFEMNGGNIEGTVQFTNRGGFGFGPDATGTADFEVHTSSIGAGIWYGGRSHPGQTIRVRSRTTSAVLEIWSNVTNGGTIVFDSLLNATGAAEFIVANGATTFTNEGRIEVGNTSLSANKTFRLPVFINTATGVIDIRDDLAIAGTDNVFTNHGTVASAAGTNIATGLRTVINQNGGELSVGGTMVLSGGFGGPSTFNFNGGSIPGEISMTGTSRVFIGPGSTGRARFVFTKSGFSNQGFLSGTIAADQEIVLRAVGTDSSQVGFASNVVNNGLISLESAPGSGGAVEINIASGTLINNNLIEMTNDGLNDATVRRTIRGSFTNTAQVTIDDHANLTGTNNVITNSGTVDVGAGARVGLGNGTIFHQNAGQLNVLGSFFFEGPPRQGADRLLYNGGNVHGEAQFVGSGYLTVGAGAGGTGVFVFRSVDGLEAQHPQLAGNIKEGQTVILRSTTAGSSQLILPGSVINDGVLMFDNASANGASLHIQGTSVLTNNGTFIVTAASPTSPKTIFGNVINHGSFEVRENIAISGTNNFLTNHGSFHVVAGTVTLGNGHLVNQEAGTMRIDGRFLLQQGGNQGPDWFNFNGGAVIGEVVLTEACRLNIGPGSVGAGRFVFGPGSGVFTGNIAPAQTVVLQANNFTAANGFTNAGTMILDNAPGSSATNTLNITTGALLNTGLFIVGDTNLAAIKNINANWTNQGRMEFRDSVTLGKASGVYSNSGKLIIAPGQTLRFSGTSFLTTAAPGGIEGGGTLAITNLTTFTAAGDVIANVINEGRTRPGQSPGILNITGNYSQTSTGILDIEIAGSAAGQFDQINISGSATLAGTLNAGLSGAHCPAGDYPILTFSSRTGDFSTKNLSAGPGRTFTTLAGDTSYAVHTNGPPCNTPPAAVDDTYTTEAGVMLTVTPPGVLGNDTDAEGDALMAVLVSGTSHGSLMLNTDGSFVYTPGPTFVPVDSFSYKANDGTVDSNVATVTITITDTLAPVTTADVSPEPNANGWNRGDVTVTLVASDAGSGVQSVTYRINGVETNVAGAIVPIALSPEGTFVIEYFATDHAGNVEATQSVTVRIDKTAPVVTAPAAVSRATGQDATTCSVTIDDAALGSATATDNLTEPAITRDGVPAGNVFPLGNTTITYIATDLAGNASTPAEQQVVVSDTTPPSIQAPGSIARSTGDSCSVFISDADLGTASATDLCGDVTVTRRGVPDGNFFPTGTTTITWIAIDAHGNESSATQQVTVSDETAPVMSCPANVDVNAAAGSCSATVNVAATATDNCGNATVSGSRSDGQALTAPYPVGTTTIQWTAMDAAGNTTSCMQTITVRDAQAPVISNASANPSTIPANGAMVDVLIGYETADNCGLVTTTLASGDPDVVIVDNHRVQVLADSARVYTIVITAVDARGNSSNATLTVHVAEDTSALSLLEQVERELMRLIALNGNHRHVKKLEHALNQVRRAIADLQQDPTKTDKALTWIKLAINDIGHAVQMGVITQETALPMLQALDSAAEMLAAETSS